MPSYYADDSFDDPTPPPSRLETFYQEDPYEEEEDVRPPAVEPPDYSMGAMYDRQAPALDIDIPSQQNPRIREGYEGVRQATADLGSVRNRRPNPADYRMSRGEKIGAALNAAAAGFVGYAGVRTGASTAPFARIADTLRHGRYRDAHESWQTEEQLAMDRLDEAKGIAVLAETEESKRLDRERDEAYIKSQQAAQRANDRRWIQREPPPQKPQVVNAGGGSIAIVSPDGSIRWENNPSAPAKPAKPNVRTVQGYDQSGKGVVSTIDLDTGARKTFDTGTSRPPRQPRRAAGTKAPKAVSPSVNQEIELKKQEALKKAEADFKDGLITAEELTAAKVKAQAAYERGVLKQGGSISETWDPTKPTPRPSQPPARPPANIAAEVDRLGKQLRFNVASARANGYSDDEILALLKKKAGLATQ